MFRIDQGYEYKGKYRGCLAELHISDDTLRSWHDYYLICQIEELYAMSHDSCEVRSVASEVNSIRPLAKRLLTADFPRIGAIEIDEKELTYCYNEGELFTARAILKSIGTFKNVSAGVRRILELESKGSWTLADIPISLDSLNAIEANAVLEEATALKLAAINHSQDGRPDLTEKVLSELEKETREVGKNYDRPNSVWTNKFNDFKVFLAETKLMEKAWEAKAMQRLRVLRTATPGSPEVTQEVVVDSTKHYGDPARTKLLTPLSRFEEAWKKSGRSLEYFLPREEYEMWKRKWS